MLWNGGIWNWLDPVTAVAGAVKAAERNPRVRLVFMRAGALEERAANREARAAHALARRLGALDRIVFFNEQGVPFTERATWLLDAACVISNASRPPREANFSFRTRLLDCFWVGLPAVCTARRRTE